MKYVKIYSNDMMPLGVVDVENLEKKEGGERYVKIRNADLLPCGVINIDGDSVDSDTARFVDVYDENMRNVGVCDVDDVISPTPTPIPIEGDVQIFADPECTQYAVGNELTVYARVNVPWGLNGGWNIEGPGAANTISCAGPTSDYPNDVYYISLWIDWSSVDYYQPFNPGQIITLQANQQQSVENPTTVFNKP